MLSDQGVALRRGPSCAASPPPGRWALTSRASGPGGAAQVLLVLAARGRSCRPGSSAVALVPGFAFSSCGRDRRRRSRARGWRRPAAAALRVVALGRLLHADTPGNSVGVSSRYWIVASGASGQDRHRLVRAVLGVVQGRLDLGRGLADQGGHLADDRRVLVASSRERTICSSTWLPTRTRAVAVDDLAAGGRDRHGSDLVGVDRRGVVLLSMTWRLHSRRTMTPNRTRTTSPTMRRRTLGRDGSSSGLATRAADVDAAPRPDRRVRRGGRRGSGDPATGRARRSGWHHRRGGARNGRSRAVARDEAASPGRSADSGRAPRRRPSASSRRQDRVRPPPRRRPRRQVER